jgi:hypothetical protein
MTLHTINPRLARIELSLARDFNAKLAALCERLEAGLRDAGHVPAVTSDAGFDGRKAER